MLRASAYIHLERYEAAIEDSETVLALAPPQSLRIRAVLRTGMAYEGLRRFELAVSHGYDPVLQIQPSNPHALAYRRSAIRRARQQAVEAAQAVDVD